MDWHNVQIWCAVAMLGVKAGSLLKWSKTTTTRFEEQSWNTTEISPSEKLHTIVERLLQQLWTTCSRLPPVRGARALPARVTKRRDTTARRRLDWPGVSNSLGMSSPAVEILAASLRPMEKSNKYQRPERGRKKSVTNLMQNRCTALRTLYKAGYLIAGCRPPNLKSVSGTTQNTLKCISRVSSRLPWRIKQWRTIVPWCHPHVWICSVN